MPKGDTVALPTIFGSAGRQRHGLVTTAIGVNVAGQRKAHVVEIDATGLTWIKSSASTGGTSACTELARTNSRVFLRCSRDRSGPRLSLAPIALVHLISWVRLAG
ncbi:MAG: DUF397 domain-containing protein [Actinophytocola sp.]|uniref:DUF397 domain-containing protein n=1 Tax=Actinophytocola sp. TaxID=1872138 RepID=UPI001328E1E4|nr:DUF397 domain-containing protein [Actinophytocola sp.]